MNDELWQATVELVEATERAWRRFGAVREAETRRGASMEQTVTRSYDALLAERRPAIERLLRAEAAYSAETTRIARKGEEVTP